MSIKFSCWQQWSEWWHGKKYDFVNFDFIMVSVEWGGYCGTGIEITLALLGLGLRVDWQIKPYKEAE